MRSWGVAGKARDVEGRRGRRWGGGGGAAGGARGGRGGGGGAPGLGAGGGASGGEAPAAKATGPVTISFMHNDSNTSARPEGATRVTLLDEFTKTNDQKI